MNKRHNQILELLTKNKKIEVTTLSEMLKVSQVTIRKDLAYLEECGLLIREHGYARLNNSDDMNIRLAYHYKQKLEVAKKAAELIHDGETLMIESGSCCALLALEIAKTKKDVTLITNSAFIADYVRKYFQIKIILLGGEYQHESQVMVGPMMSKCAATFFVDKLFIGTDGFSITTGFTGNDYMRCEAVKDMAKQANQVIIVTESDKFHQTGMANLISLDQVSSVYTDSGIPQEIEEYFNEKKIKIEKV
ncbi:MULTISPECIES: DeoR/GlpR family DNA-binding transcription regulator [Coprobacillaceae]|uniref:DeoR/GlpR family DNA-binding transcription regulator n=1 Tax=Coprobacillaceae TaxID=2810280 RepID=UPI000E4EDB93|nr:MULTISPECIES: DeoR/GlpR family DNA-binding transcription regulator [Coprobacillaceae]RHM58937.1 DeoR/GlpR transcriptional regulator [Coprobacillus sp. AF33-1AC]RHS95742.1 DeoR/GlpR transcriptional regulator [Erysipelatoclostridium sp. AM42-17]